MFNTQQMIVALQETIFMAGISLSVAVIMGLGLGTLIYTTQKGGLWEVQWLNQFLQVVVNVLRAIPFIILLILLIPITKVLVGSMLGAKAAVPALIVSAAPFYARMTMIGLNEVGRGTIEASVAMGASKWQILTKVIIPEAMPALVGGVTVTGISLIGYTAMAGAIGAGGLGNLAYLYGFARNNPTVTYLATALILIIVFFIQAIGDWMVRKIDKR
jgi:D-methionine transport system permease protein